MDDTNVAWIAWVGSQLLNTTFILWHMPFGWFSLLFCYVGLPDQLTANLDNHTLTASNKKIKGNSKYLERPMKNWHIIFTAIAIKLAYTQFEVN